MSTHCPVLGANDTTWNTSVLPKRTVLLGSCDPSQQVLSAYCSTQPLFSCVDFLLCRTSLENSKVPQLPYLHR